VLTAVVQFFIARQVFRLDFGQTYWLRVCLFVVFAVLISYLSRYINVHWLWQLLIVVGINVLLVFMTGIIRPKEIIKLLGEAKVAR
jgi:hypothetical protein